MSKKEEGKDMAIRSEDIKNAKVTADRKKLIRKIANKVIDRNEEAFRRLSKD